MNQRDLAAKYFRALEAGDVEEIMALCLEDAIIYETRLSPERGKSGARTAATSFLKLTARRTFELDAVAEEGNVLYVWWRCGITRFLFNDAGLIRELDSGHETVA